MDKLSELYQKLGDTMGGLFEYIRERPVLAGFVIAGIGLFMLIALIMDADWMLEGSGSGFNIASVSKIFGRKTARIIMAIPCILLILAGLGMAWGYSNL